MHGSWPVPASHFILDVLSIPGSQHWVRPLVGFQLMLVNLLTDTPTEPQPIPGPWAISSFSFPDSYKDWALPRRSSGASARIQSCPKLPVLLSISGSSWIDEGDGRFNEPGLGPLQRNRHTTGGILQMRGLWSREMHMPISTPSVINSN